MRYLNINPCKYVCVIVLLFGILSEKSSIENANFKFEFIAHSWS